MQLRLDPTSGALVAAFGVTGAQPRLEITLPPIIVDGRPQADFRRSSGDASSPADGLPAAATEFVNDSLRVQIEPPLPGASSAAVTWTTLDDAPHEFEILISDNSAYYGCGERFSSLNHKGHILPMVSIDRPEDKGSISYKPVPFYMSTRGYAAWLDTPAPAMFDLNATDREHVRLRVRARRLRLSLIDGPDMAAMLNEFTRLTGRPRVPPAWAFAPWKSRNVHNNRDEVLADAELTRRHDLPGSVIVIDSPWETGYNDFVLNETQFRDPKGMFDRLHELGFYSCLWLTPFINVENVVDMAGIESGPCRNFEEAARSGFLVRQPNGDPMIVPWWKGRGALVDFTNPAATEWWHKQIDQTLAWGVRAFKCDDGEGNFVQDAVFHDGAPANEMKNRYASLYLAGAQEYIDTRLGGDGVLLARCGHTGTQRYPFCWAGDNEASFSFENGLPTVVLAAQNAALSGLPFWGHDIAGYIGTPSKELFIRWTQFGAFSPLMQIHTTSNLGPWDFDEQTLAIYRSFAKLHTSLYPYIREAAEEAARTGMPIMRPMALAFPDDPEAASHRYQYLFGPDLLVAPMIQPGTRRSVYLPKSPGTPASAWIDYWSGEALSGGRTIEVHAPLERMPIFVREGALICTLPDDVDTLIPRHDRMSADVVAMDERRVLQVWPGAARSLATHDGLSAALTRKDNRVTLRLTATTPREIEIRRMFVQLDGAPSPPPHEEDWTFEPNGRTASRSLRIGPAPASVTWVEP